MTDYQAATSLPAIFFDQAAARSDKAFLWARRNDGYRPLTWRQVETAVKDLARGLRGLGLQGGERVVLLAENRPEWLIADLAIMAAGGITVPAYTTNTTSDHSHILADSGARGVIVSTRALAKTLIPAAMEASDCRWIVGIEGPAQAPPGQLDFHLWPDILAKGAATPDDVGESVARIARTDTACLIYTSGTGGVPKGVMLSHGAIISNCMGAEVLLSQIGLGQDVFLSFLPLSHAYEHMAGQFFPISIGAEIYYATGIDKLTANLIEARPTIMTAVPRLYEIMYQRIIGAVNKQGGHKKRLFELALRLGRKRILNPRSLTLWERTLDLAAEHLVRNRMRGRFGGRLKVMVSGGAALNPDIGIFFTALGLRILQGYGLTESAPVIAFNPPHKVKMHTVGPPLEGVEVKIAADGEILARGELLMQGYWHNEEATAAALRDGWLHTGDIGRLDEDGYLQITDRKKDIIVLSGGDNVSPARIESLLTLQPEIQQALVHGDKRPHLVAILVPDDDFLSTFASQSGKPADLTKLCTDPALHAALSGAVDRVNRDLASFERIRRFTIADCIFTIDNKMMTPSMKIRRHAVFESHGKSLEKLY